MLIFLLCMICIFGAAYAYYRVMLILFAKIWSLALKKNGKTL